MKSAFNKEKNKFLQPELNIKSSRKASYFSAGPSNICSYSGNQIGNNNNKLSFSTNNLSNFNPNLLKSPFDLNSKATNNVTNLTSTSCNNATSFSEMENKDFDGFSALKRTLSLLENFFVFEEKIKFEENNINNHSNEKNFSEIKLCGFEENCKTEIIENLLEIKIKTSEGNIELFRIEKHFGSNPELLRKNLSEFIECKKLNKYLLWTIIDRINESVFSLNEILQQKISKKFLEDFLLLEKNKNVNENFSNKKILNEELELEELLNRNFFSDDNKNFQKLICFEEKISEENFNEKCEKDEKDEKVSFMLFNRTSVSTCQSEDEDEEYCDLLLNKTL
jgi:hypothetical protein